MVDVDELEWPTWSAGSTVVYQKKVRDHGIGRVFRFHVGRTVRQENLPDA